MELERGVGMFTFQIALRTKVKYTTANAVAKGHTF